MQKTTKAVAKKPQTGVLQTSRPDYQIETITRRTPIIASPTTVTIPILPDEKVIDKFTRVYYFYLFMQDLTKTDVLVASYLYSLYDNTKYLTTSLRLPLTISRTLNIKLFDVNDSIDHLKQLGLFQICEEELLNEETGEVRTIEGYIPTITPNNIYDYCYNHTEFVKNCEQAGLRVTAEEED